LQRDKDDDLTQLSGVNVMPNIRLANGLVRQETRQRLMLAFNTPFFPEVLVASSVLAEGVDPQNPGEVQLTPIATRARDETLAAHARKLTIGREPLGTHKAFRNSSFYCEKVQTFDETRNFDHSANNRTKT